MAVFDLLEGVVVVISLYSVSGAKDTGRWKDDLRRNRDVAAVDDFAPEIEGVGFHGSVVESERQSRARSLSLAGRTYTLYPPLNRTFREPSKSLSQGHFRTY